jgi:hypothetical protein
MVGGDLLITAAVGAKRFAKWKMYIETDPPYMIFIGKLFRKQAHPFAGLQVVFPIRHGGITGIPGKGLVVFSDQQGIDDFFHPAKLAR